MKESDISHEIMIAMSEKGCRVFKNVVGLFKLESGDRIRTGLCVGSSDLIGWTPTGRFLAIEVKTKRGYPTPEQVTFIKAVNQAGGIGFVARSAQEAVQKLHDFKPL